MTGNEGFVAFREFGSVVHGMGRIGASSAGRQSNAVHQANFSLGLVRFACPFYNGLDRFD